MSRPVLVAYLSGHGFGHFIRSEVVLQRLAGDVEIHVRTNGRALELARAASWPASVGEVDLGPGAMQRGPLAVDLDATHAALEAHHAAWPAIIDDEAAFVRATGAKLVYADVPPVAFEIAARASLPSVALANFSWSFIYDAWRDLHPTFAAAATRAREAESRAKILFALEMGAGLESFPRQLAVRPVARKITRARAQLRAALPFEDDGRPIVLVSFGGFGAELSLPRNRGGHRWLVVSARVDESDDVRVVVPSATLPHQDLVAAVDCVVGKPGYGTAAECLARPTPFCYLPREDFPESPPLVAGMRRWLPSAPISAEELRAGELDDAVDRARENVPAEVPPVSDGGAQVAAILWGMLS